MKIVFEIMKEKLKIGRMGIIREEKKRVNEERWSISSRQTNCYNNSVGADRAGNRQKQNKAFSSGCDLSTEKENENFSCGHCFSFVNLPLRT